MIEHEEQSNLSRTVIRFDDLHTLCAQAAAHLQLDHEADHQPTADHVSFFTMVWIVKQAKSQAANVQYEWNHKYVVGLRTEEVQEHAARVAGHLAHDSIAVDHLKSPKGPTQQKPPAQTEEILDEIVDNSATDDADLYDKEWELLRIQMEKGVLRYACPQETKDDALQKGLIKIFAILSKMTDIVLLEHFPNPFDWIEKHEDLISNMYDFGVPVYAWAQRIARNELISLLRREPIEDELPKALHPMSEPLERSPRIDGVGGQWASAQKELQISLYGAPSEPLDPAIVDEQIYERARLQASIDLKRLLVLIDEKLPPKQQGVVYHTLAARPQFWKMLDVTALAPPMAMPPQNDQATDETIAEALEMSVNSVRVNRNHAKKYIAQNDIPLGYWLEELMLDPGKHAGKGRRHLLMSLTKLRDQNAEIDDSDAA